MNNKKDNTVSRGEYFPKPEINNISNGEIVNYNDLSIKWKHVYYGSYPCSYYVSLRNLTTNLLLIKSEYSPTSGYTIPKSLFTGNHVYRFAVKAADYMNHTAWSQVEFGVSSSGNFGLPVNTLNELKNLPSEIDIVARTIYGECDDERTYTGGLPYYGEYGQYSVAWTIINRKYNSSSDYYGQSYKSIVLAPSQYVAITEDENGLCRHPNTSTLAWKRSLELAHLMVNNNQDVLKKIIPNVILDRMHFFAKTYINNPHIGNPIVVSDNVFFYWV